MGVDFSFPDSLEKYGIVGVLVFAALAAGTAIWWNAMVGAFEAYQKQRRKRLKAVVARPLMTFILVLVPLIAAVQIVAATKKDLRRAARLVDGNWTTHAQGCGYARLFRVDGARGVLVVQTRGRFRFIYDLEAIDQSYVQARARGAAEPRIFERRGGKLFEISLGGGRWELMPCPL